MANTIAAPWCELPGIVRVDSTRKGKYLLPKISRTSSFKAIFLEQNHETEEHLRRET
jgi:hypothetical protein